jgi:hypothetical protein
MREGKFENPVDGGHKSSPSSILIEVGSDLAYLLKSSSHLALISTLERLRNNLMKEWGISLPDFCIRENFEIDTSTYRFVMFDREIAKRQVPPGKTLVITDVENLPKIPGEMDFDPIYSRPCTWIESSALRKNLKNITYSATIEEVIVEHLETSLRSNVNELISAEMVKEKLHVIYMNSPELVQETLRKLGFSELVRVIKNLVPEGIPFTHLNEVIRIIADSNIAEDDPDMIAEKLRRDLKDKLYDFIFSDRLLLFVVPDSRLQLWLYNHARSGTPVSEEDPVIQNMFEELANLHIALHARGLKLGLICCGSIRLFLRRIIEKKLPNIVVIKPEEIEPSYDIKIIKKIKTKSLKVKIFWLWFWLTGPHIQKKRFRDDLNTLFEYLKKRFENMRKTAIIKHEPPMKPVMFQQQNLTPLVKPQNLPLMRAYSAKQRAAATLLKCNAKYFKSIMNVLNRKQIVFISGEMAGLCQDMEDGRNFFCEDLDELVIARENTDELVHLIREASSREPDLTKISPLQKLAVFLSSLSTSTAENMYTRILTGMSRDEIRELSECKHKQQVISIRKLRAKVIEDFMWYLKGNILLNAPYSSSLWLEDLRIIALNNPRKMASAIHDLWLSDEVLIERFDRFTYQNPTIVAFWIKSYLTSCRDRGQYIDRIEKAYILLQLLPEEIASGVIRRFDKLWLRIFRNSPRKPGEITPEESGLVLPQFLSYYYSAYEPMHPLENSNN